MADKTFTNFNCAKHNHENGCHCSSVTVLGLSRVSAAAPSFATSGYDADFEKMKKAYEWAFDEDGDEALMNKYEAFEAMVVHNEYQRPEGVCRYDGTGERASLSEAIAYVKAMPPETPFVNGLANPHSNRGDYKQLGVEIGPAMTAAEVVKALESADGKTYRGWKGGDYRMSGKSAVYLCSPGQTGIDLTFDNIESLRLGITPLNQEYTLSW